jgi:hypothetical protein
VPCYVDRISSDYESYLHGHDIRSSVKNPRYDHDAGGGTGFFSGRFDKWYAPLGQSKGAENGNGCGTKATCVNLVFVYLLVPELSRLPGTSVIDIEHNQLRIQRR